MPFPLLQIEPLLEPRDISLSITGFPIKSCPWTCQLHYTLKADISKKKGFQQVLEVTILISFQESSLETAAPWSLQN